MMQQVAQELNLASPGAVISSADNTIKQLLALAQREGKELAKNYEWPVLQKETTISLVDGTGSYALASDFSRFINQTEWDRTNHWQLLGPMSPQEYQWRVSGITITTPRRRFRVRGASSTQMIINPTPSSGETGQILAYEYVSNQWCQSSGGSGQTTWQSDDDTGVISEDLMGMGLKWRWLKAKGLNYDEEYREYQAACDRDFAQSAGAPELQIGRRAQLIIGLTNAAVPETGFGS